MNKKEKYKNDLKFMTDTELSGLARKFLVQGQIGFIHGGWQHQLVYDELTHRNPAIFESAVEDAVAAIQKIDEYSEFNRSGMLPGLRQIPLDELQAEFSELRNYPTTTGLDIQGLFGIARENLLLFRVNGESMLDAGINENDVLIVEKNTQPQDNDIVVVSVEGVVFVKRYSIRNGEKWLVSANKKYEPVKISSGISMEIIGKVKMTLHNVINGQA